MIKFVENYTGKIRKNLLQFKDRFEYSPKDTAFSLLMYLFCMSMIVALLVILIVTQPIVAAGTAIVIGASIVLWHLWVFFLKLIVKLIR